MKRRSFLSLPLLALVPVIPVVPVPAKAMAFVHRGEAIVPKFHIPSEVDERTMRQIEAAAMFNKRRK